MKKLDRIIRKILQEGDTYEKIAAKDIQIYFAEGELGKNARLKGSSFTSENNISTIVMIGVTSRSKSNYSFSNTNAYASAYSTQSSVSASGSSYTSGGNVNYTSGLSLKMDIFSIDNSFDKPVGVIMGEATGDWGVASSERSIAKKILRRMLDGLFWEKAFEE